MARPYPKGTIARNGAARLTHVTRRHPFTPIKAAVFFCRPGLLIARFLKVCLGPLREEDTPRRHERGARQVERRGGTASALAWSRARIEAAAPLPFGCSTGIANALRDRAGEHVAIVDAPSLLATSGSWRLVRAGMPDHLADQAGTEAARTVSGLTGL
jgi:hypothetical protein